MGTITRVDSFGMTERGVFCPECRGPLDTYLDVVDEPGGRSLGAMDVIVTVVLRIVCGCGWSWQRDREG